VLLGLFGPFVCAVDDDRPLNLLHNPSFAVGRRHWHPFRSSVRAGVEHMGDRNEVDEEIHNALVFDGAHAMTAEVHGVFQTVVFRPELLLLHDDDDDDDDDDEELAIELAAVWRTHDLKGGFFGLDISMDVLFADSTHLLDQRLATVVAVPSADDAGDRLWHDPQSGGPQRWVSGCRRVLVGKAPLRMPTSASVFLLFDARVGRAYIANVSLRVVRSAGNATACAFSSPGAWARAVATVRSDGAASAVPRTPDTIVDWRLPTVRQVRLLRARSDGVEAAPDVTAVTLASLDRFDRVLLFARFWRGPLAATLLVQNESVLAGIVEQWQPLARYLTLEVVRSVDDVQFPINELRNRAIDLVTTSHFIVIDADFVPSPDMRERTRAHLRAIARNASLVDGFQGVPATAPVRPFHFALVAPAFESQAYSASDAASLTREQMVRRWRSENDPKPAHMFASAAHGATDFERWANATRPFAVRYESHFEPYYVVPVDSERYDARFRGYGADKSEHCYAQERLRRAQMAVMPDVWMIHIEHQSGAWKAGQAPILKRVWQNWYARLLEVDRAVRRHDNEPHDWLTLERTFNFHDWQRMVDCCLPPDPCLIDLSLGLDGDSDFVISWRGALFLALFAVPLWNSIRQCAVLQDD
jgi:hypothetical protein